MIAEALRLTSVALVALASLATPALSEPRDRLFEPGTLAALLPGSVLEFTRTRTVPSGSELEAISDGSFTIRIAASDGAPGNALVLFDEPDRKVRLPPAPTTAAHPALLVFLESTVSSLAAISGGSPHYIKNRFIEAFAEPEVEAVEAQFEGNAIGAERMVFHPFGSDPNAARLGDLVGLELAFVLSEEVPGRLLSATASGGDFSHSIVLQSMESEE